MAFLAVGGIDGLSSLVIRNARSLVDRVFIGAFFVVVLSFVRLPVVFQSSTFRLAAQPLISCLGLLCSVHLIMTLEAEAYIRLLSWILLSVLIYLFYGMHHTSDEQCSDHENTPREVDPLFT